MTIPEDERSELHDTNEAGEIQDFCIRIAAIQDTREVEEFGPLVDFRPKSFFQSFLRCTEGCSLLDQVQVCEDTNDFGETM